MNGYRSFCWVLFMLMLAGAIAACSEIRPSTYQMATSSDEEWVSGFCQAAVRLSESAPEGMDGPLTSDFLKAMAPGFMQFAEDLAALPPPRGLEAYHDAYVEGAREAAEVLALGELTRDPFVKLEQLQAPAGFETRFVPLALADADCRTAGITFEDFEARGE